MYIIIFLTNKLPFESAVSKVSGRNVDPQSQELTIPPAASQERSEMEEKTDDAFRNIVQDKNTLVGKKDANDLTLQNSEIKTISKGSRSNSETPKVNNLVGQSDLEKNKLAKEIKSVEDSLNDLEDKKRMILLDLIVGQDISARDSTAISPGFTRPMTARAPPPKARKAEVIQETLSV